MGRVPVSYRELIKLSHQVIHLVSGLAQLQGFLLQLVLHFVQCLHHFIFLLGLCLTFPLLLL